MKFVSGTYVRRLGLGVILGMLASFAVAEKAEAQQANATPIAGVWSLEFCWDGSPCGTTSLTINQFGPFVIFTTGDGFDGVGLALNSIAILHINGGCEPNYIAFAPTSSFMQGRMRCSDGNPAGGTWSATLGVGVGETAGGGSSAGPH